MGRLGNLLRTRELLGILPAGNYHSTVLRKLPQVDEQLRGGTSYNILSTKY